MSTLGDNELSLIFHWINDSNDRNSLSLVCKEWLRVEVETRLSIRVILIIAHLPSHRWPSPHSEALHFKQL